MTKVSKSTDATSTGATGTQVLWDRQEALEIIPSPNRGISQFFESLGFQYSADPTSFVRYVPLYYNEKPIRALTVYLTQGATIGIETHFEGFSELSGIRKRLGIHFILQPTERIAHVWIRANGCRRIFIVS